MSLKNCPIGSNKGSRPRVSTPVPSADTMERIMREVRSHVMLWQGRIVRAVQTPPLVDEPSSKYILDILSAQRNCHGLGIKHKHPSKISSKDTSESAETEYDTKKSQASMSQNTIEHMSTTPSYVLPARFDSRVVVKPCEPDRIPYLPLEIIYQIAEALPQPKQILNLAIASKEVWEYLQPALYKSEVTYEARLIHRYGGESSTSLYQYYGEHLESDKSETTESGKPSTGEGAGCQTGCDLAPKECNECEGQITLEDRTFEANRPRSLLCTVRRMTALHWASIQGPSALFVAQRAIRAALVHQPSYINGTNLKERQYYEHLYENSHPADLPPPLFLAVAHGNTAVVQALVDAGCELGLFQGQDLCDGLKGGRRRILMSYKIHKECVRPRGEETEHCFCGGATWQEDFHLKACHTVGHVAIAFQQTELLEMLLRSGLNAQQGSCALLHYAVLEGNIAAVKVILDHDRNLIHSRMDGGTVLHTANLMRRNWWVREFIQRERFGNMVSYLLERGADLEARSDSLKCRRDRDLEFGKLTPLQAALAVCEIHQVDKGSLTALHVATVFISMGASWNQEFPTRTFRREIFDYCVENSVGLLESRLGFGADNDDFGFFRDYYGKGYSPDQVTYRGIRMAMGRVIKAIIEQATESWSQDDTTLNRDTHKAIFSKAFSKLANHKRGRFFVERGPFAAEAVGRLLLSTGITANDEEMRNWRAQIDDGDEANPGSGDESDADHERDERDLSGGIDGESRARSRDSRAKERAEDGDRSQWAFLWTGTDDEKLDI